MSWRCGRTTEERLQRLSFRKDAEESLFPCPFNAKKSGPQTGGATMGPQYSRLYRESMRSGASQIGSKPEESVTLRLGITWFNCHQKIPRFLRKSLGIRQFPRPSVKHS